MLEPVDRVHRGRSAAPPDRRAVAATRCPRGRRTARRSPFFPTGTARRRSGCAGWIPPPTAQVTHLEDPPLTRRVVAGWRVACLHRARGGSAAAAAWAPAAILPLLRRPAARVQLFVDSRRRRHRARASRSAISISMASLPGCRTANRFWSPPPPPPDAAHALEGGEIYAVRIAGGERRQITRHPGSG